MRSTWALSPPPSHFGTFFTLHLGPPLKLLRTFFALHLGLLSPHSFDPFPPHSSGPFPPSPPPAPPPHTPPWRRCVSWSLRAAGPTCPSPARSLRPPPVPARRHRTAARAPARRRRRRLAVRAPLRWEVYKAFGGVGGAVGVASLTAPLRPRPPAPKPRPSRWPRPLRPQLGAIRGATPDSPPPPPKSAPDVTEWPQNAAVPTPHRTNWPPGPACLPCYAASLRTAASAPAVRMGSPR